MEAPLVRCSKCHEYLPITSFSKSSAKKNGLQSQCKPCRALIHIEYRARHPYPRKRPKHNLTKSEYAHQYYLAHRDEIIARVHQYRIDNKDRLREVQKRWRAKNAENRLQYSRDWANKHKERLIRQRREYYMQNKNRIQKGNQAWRKNNPERVRAIGRASTNRRRAFMLACDGKYTKEDAKAQHKRQKGRCYWCSKYVGKVYDLDHVVPLSRGGSNYPDNIVVACPHCNRSKGAKLPHEWSKGGRLL